MAKIVVVADRDVATYFRTAGVELSYGVENSKLASELILKMAEDKDVAIIVVTEKIADEIKGVIDEISKRTYPTILTIPGKEGPVPGKVSPIMDLVKRTIGVEIKLS